MNLSLQNISKTYEKGKKPALSTFSFSFTNGLYGLLGPNGAGKSTLMNLIVQNIAPDTGTILLDGCPINDYGDKYRSLIGYMPQQQNLYEEFTGNDFLWYMATLKGLSKNIAEERIEKMIHVTNLKKYRYEKIGNYSGGMKQRLLIAQALLNNPQILLMDEPTVGLDPQERVRIRNFISNLSSSRIIILATHIVSDIENIAHSILVMNRGQLLSSGTTEELVNELNGKVYEIVTDKSGVRYYNNHNANITNILHSSDGIHLRLVSETAPIIGISHSVTPRLEDYYSYKV